MFETKHGERHTRLYGVWNMMKQRCTDKNNAYYNNYGGRGISVCEEWEEFQSFSRWAHENGYDASAEKGECTLDRIDNNGNYCPNNCRWVSRKEQARNRRSNHLLEYHGKTKTLAEWAEQVGIKAATIMYRLRNGWDMDDALTIKPMIGRNQSWKKAN